VKRGKRVDWGGTVDFLITSGQTKGRIAAAHDGSVQSHSPGCASMHPIGIHTVLLLRRFEYINRGHVRASVCHFGFRKLSF